MYSSSWQINYITEEKDIPILSNVSDVIQKLFAKCINFDVKNRITTEEIRVLFYEFFALFIDEFYYIKFITNKNNSSLLCYIGYLYENGYVVKQDYLKSKEYYELAGNQIDSYIFIYIANLYLEGRYPITQDYVKAKKYYELAAKNNYPYSYSYLGYLYENGYGVERNYKKAKEYYELAAKNCDTNGYISLGNLYKQGFGVKLNYKKAKEYYEMALELYDFHAYFYLGNLYLMGNGVKQDYSIAKQYFENSINEELQTRYAYNFISYISQQNTRDCSKTTEFYELTSPKFNSYSLNILGCLYENGLGVKQDYIMAKEYYELAAEHSNSSGFNSLGNLYKNGYGVVPDYLRAKDYYEKAAKLNNSNAFFNLGNLYENGYGVEKNYLKAKEYYEKAAKLNNSNAFFNLGNLYENGYGVEQNYLKAKYYYKLASKKKNDLNATFKLGQLYYEGEKINQDYKKAKKYFELAFYIGNCNSLFYLGDLYLRGDISTIDIPNAIQFFQKSIEIPQEKIMVYNYVDKCYNFNIINNKIIYHSYNDLGLIYLTVYNNIEEANKYIKEAAFAEYPFGQNNLGILNEFHFKNNKNAEYMYKKSSKHNFPLAEFNLGRMLEKENKINESIKYFILASEHEDEPLVYHGTIRDDKQLKISKKFIICLTNLKLFIHYMSKHNYDESKKYFKKAFNGLELNTKDMIYQFKFRIQREYSDDHFSYLKKYIFNYPLFNLINRSNFDIKLYSEIFGPNKDVNYYQIEATESNEKCGNKRKEPFIFEIGNGNCTNKQEKNCKNISSKIKEEKIYNQYTEKKEKEINVYENKCLLNDEINEQNKNHQCIKNASQMKNELCESENEFQDPCELFDFVISSSNSDSKLKEILIKEIKSIIDIMIEILYTPPYPILFGRIIIAKPKVESKQKEINGSFYDGFGII